MSYYLVYKDHNLKGLKSYSSEISDDMEALSLQEAELLQAILSKMGFEFNVVDKTPQQLSLKPNSSDTAISRFEQLTTREIEVCRLLCLGAHPKHIASKLDMMPKTVLVHRANIYRKLGVNAPISLLRAALAAGFIKTSELLAGGL